MNYGPVLSFQVSCRCGLRPNARQIRLIAVWLSSVALAIDRVDQCVSAPGGRCSRVLTITSSTFPSVILRGWPGRGSSDSPSSRRSTNLARHLPTICGVTPSRAATCLFGVPSAQASTILDRSARAWAVVARRAHPCSICRSSPVSTSGALGRPVLAIRQVYHLYRELMTRDTSGSLLTRDVEVQAAACR